MTLRWLRPGVFRSDLETITNRASNDLQALVNKNLLLTGSTGFVGTWLASSFLFALETFNGNGTLTCVARSFDSLDATRSNFHSHPNVRLLKSDIRSLEIPDNQRIDLILHAATPASATHNALQPLDMISTIIDGQKRVMETAKNAKVQRVVFMSSGAVYGPQPTTQELLPTDWNGSPDITNPLNAYHEAKRLAELIGHIYAQEGSSEFVTARLFAFLAPYLPIDAHFAAGNFIKDALQGAPPAVRGNGNTVRSYQYGSDMATWIWAIAARGVNRNAYNVGSQDHLTIADLAGAVARLAELQSVDATYSGDPNAQVSRYVPDVSQTMIELGVSNLHDLDSSILRTLQWHQE